MFLTKLQTGVALVATTLLLAGSALLLHPATAEVPKSPGFTEAEFNELKAKLDVHNQPWASIPWQVSLTEARELAARTRKPIFMTLGTGNPLGWG